MQAVAASLGAASDMAEQSLTPIGPWSGINNVLEPHAPPFQPGGESIPALVSARNVDINDHGWPRSRKFLLDEVLVPGALGLWSVAGRLFWQGGATLYERRTGDVPVLTGLARRVSIAEHWGRLYVTDGVNHFEIDGEEVRNWGLPVPALSSLAQTSGDLYAPGRYAVRAAFVDARGNEGGVSPPSEIVLTGGIEAQPARIGGISLTVSGASAAVVGVNLYVSEADQPTESFADYFDIGDPVEVTGLSTVSDPPRTDRMRGPIAGADGIFSFRAFLLMWRGAVVFRSEAAEPHLFDAVNLMQFPAPVVAAEGVETGMWIATERGLWWVSGESPESWVPSRKLDSTFYPGSICLPGSRFPRLQTGGQVVLFASDRGLVAGLPSGDAVELTAKTYHFTPGSRFDFCYVERDNLSQLLVNVWQP